MASEKIDLERIDIGDIKIRPVEQVARREKVVFSYAGLLFLLASISALAVLVYMLFQMHMFLGMPKERILDLSYFLNLYIAPAIVFASAALSAMIGYILLKAAGTSAKEVLPARDFDLLSHLLTESKDKGIDEYIRLSSLSGITGFFTKIGLTGLPLATIALTLLFSTMAIFKPELFDLAKLTLGAFLGSYVQRQAGEKKLQE